MGAWDQEDLIDRDSNLFGLNVLGEEWVGTIREPKWATDIKVQNGEKLFLAMNVETGHANPEFATLELRWNIGDKWESKDGGKTAVPLKSDTKVHPKSAFGMFLTRLLELPDAKAAMMEKAKSPFEAAAYDGLTFVWGVHTEDYGGDIGKIDRWMPTAFGDTPPESSSKSTTTETPSRETVEEQLIELAKASGSDDEFLQKAMTVDGFTDYEDLVSGYKAFYKKYNK